jgi:hypothetical protein
MRAWTFVFVVGCGGGVPVDERVSAFDPTKDATPADGDAFVVGETPPAAEKVCGIAGETYIRDPRDLAGCTVFRGSIHVSDRRDAHLPWPASLRRIEGALSFFRNEFLEDLRGLEGLEEVGGLVLNIHPKLRDLRALARTKVSGEFFVASSDLLETLEGPQVSPELDSLFLARQPKLRDLSALSAIRRIRGKLVIRNNRALTDAAARAFADRIDVGGPIEIMGNGVP